MILLKKRKIESPVSILGGKRQRTNLEGRLSPHQQRVPFSKRVSFTSNGSNIIRTSERYIEIYRSELDKPNLWYTRKEREETFAECEDAIENFKNEHVDEVSKFVKVFEQCCQSPSHESSEFLETAQLHIPSSVRGMEWGFGPYVETYRKDHVRDVLKVQEQIQGLKPAMRDHLLSSRSLKSSRAGRVMARLLGECDARNVSQDDEQK